MLTKKITDKQRDEGRRGVVLTSAAVGKKNPRSPLRMAWQERPYQQMGIASEIAQVSEAALYKAEKEGELTFVRLAGRTLVDTASLIAFIGRAEPWVSSDRGAAARAKRAETARAALRR